MKNTIQGIRRLEYNWDEEGAEPIYPIICNTAETLVSCVKFELDIYPTSRGFIQLEYKNSLGEYIEIEVHVDVIKVFAFNNNYDLLDCVVFDLVHFKECLDLINDCCER